MIPADDASQDDSSATKLATSMDECGSSHGVPRTCTKPPLIERNWLFAEPPSPVAGVTARTYRPPIAMSRCSTELNVNDHVAAFFKQHNKNARATDTRTAARGRRSKRNKRSRFEIWKSRRGARAPLAGVMAAATNQRPRRARGDAPLARTLRDIIFSTRTLFSFFPSLARPFNRQRKWNEREYTAPTRVLARLLLACPDVNLLHCNLCIYWLMRRALDSRDLYQNIIMNRK